ncbi:head-tail connector protein [Anaerovibrio sp. JC8]|uniref:head-tail connector protein n=1 Tax=Anaerovibrio sp. JC8 TaxID=1240085 RepID=UPI000A0FC311
MKVSDIDITTLKNYLRVDSDQDDTLLQHILQASVEFCQSYTGLDLADLDNYSDIPLAVLALCADMYENREYITDRATTTNPTVIQILHSHCNNFL